MIFKFTILVLSLFLSAASFAQNPPLIKPPIYDPCKEDAAKFCKGKFRDGGGLRECLVENRPKFTLTCQKFLAFINERHDKTPAKCVKEAMRVCGQKKAGEGETFFECLRLNPKKFPKDCVEGDTKLGMKFTVSHNPNLKKGVKTPKVPTKIMADPETVKPPPPPPPEPPPEGWVPPEKRDKKPDAHSEKSTTPVTVPSSNPATKSAPSAAVVPVPGKTLAPATTGSIEKTPAPAVSPNPTKTAVPTATPVSTPVASPTPISTAVPVASPTPTGN